MPLHLAILFLNLVLASVVAGGVLALRPVQVMPRTLRVALVGMALVDLAAALVSVLMLDPQVPLTNVRLLREGVLPLCFQVLGCVAVWIANVHSRRNGS